MEIVIWFSCFAVHSQNSNYCLFNEYFYSYVLYFATQEYHAVSCNVCPVSDQKVLPCMYFFRALRQLYNFSKITLVIIVIIIIIFISKIPEQLLIFLKCNLCCVLFCDFRRKFQGNRKKIEKARRCLETIVMGLLCLWNLVTKHMLAFFMPQKWIWAHSN